MIDGILSTLSALMDPSSPWIYLIAFTGGLLSSFLPCSLSSLPLVIGYVSGGRRDTRSAFRLSLVFAIGMAVTYTVLATVALALGSLIGSTSRIWYMVLAVLTLLMALQLSGLFTIIPASNLQTRNTKRGYFGALVAGLLSGVFSSPCSTPVLVALLSIASVSGSVWISAFLLLCYSVGYSILSIVAGTFAGFVTKLSSSSAYGKAGKAVSVILAIALLMLSFYLFYQAF